jgi:hypothetical protein
LERLAIAETATEDAERAARLLGAGSAVREQSGVPRSRWDQGDLDRASETLRGALGAAGFDRAWQEGRQMGHDETIAYALSPDASSDV